MIRDKADVCAGPPQAGPAQGAIYCPSPAPTVRLPPPGARFTTGEQHATGNTRIHCIGNSLTVGVLNQFVENFAGQASTGILHSDQLALTETRSIDSASDELLLEWTMEDPAYFTAPFSGSQRLVRSDLKLQRYNCVPDVPQE